MCARDAALADASFGLIGPALGHWFARQVQDGVGFLEARFGRRSFRRIPHGERDAGREVGSRVPAEGVERVAAVAQHLQQTPPDKARSPGDGDLHVNLIALVYSGNRPYAGIW